MLQRLIRSLTGAMRRRRTPGRAADPESQAAQKAVRTAKRKM